MLDIIDLSIQYGGKELFENVNLKINPSDKIALIGSNGTGKSTLLKLISGKETPEAGKIQYQKGLKIGYLPQEILNKYEKVIFEEVKSSLTNIIDLAVKEEELNNQLKNEFLSEDEKDKIIHKIGEIHDQKLHTDFYKIDSDIEKVLMGLGFTENDFDRPLSEFSGGWQMRVELAKLLLNNNDLILLDEPTNHLDLDSLRWLLNFLKNAKEALLIVSHDKYFLNEITNKTIEIFNRNVTLYNGKYDDYIEYKRERDELLIKQRLNQEKKIKETEKFIERFRYKATKARQVQSRIKQLEKIDISDLPEYEDEINLRFQEPERSGSVPVNIEDLSFAYEADNFILKSIDLNITRGEKIALVGPNGAGKTTLAKLIAEKLKPSKGKLIIGYNTTTSYYSQEVADNLDLSKSILETLEDSAKDYTTLQLRIVLGSFLFRDDDVFKKVGVLSGGEKSRVALAKIMLNKANLIILDEPTNHLDMNSKRILQKALAEFGGTLIIVSHDVDFLRPIVDKVVDVRNKNIKIFEGDIDYYLFKTNFFEENNSQLKQITVDEEKKENRKDRKRLEAEVRNKKHEATKDLKKKIDTCENRISELEAEKEILEKELMDEKIYTNAETAKAKTSRYEKIKNELEKNYEEWTTLHDELEKIEESFNKMLS
jgi:ATP-binding cassette subfamily F protein 3